MTYEEELKAAEDAFLKALYAADDLEDAMNAEIEEVRDSYQAELSKAREAQDLANAARWAVRYRKPTGAA